YRAPSVSCSVTMWCASGRVTAAAALPMRRIRSTIRMVGKKCLCISSSKRAETIVTSNVRRHRPVTALQCGAPLLPVSDKSRQASTKHAIRALPGRQQTAVSRHGPAAAKGFEDCPQRYLVAGEYRLAELLFERIDQLEHAQISAADENGLRVRSVDAPDQRDD